MEERLLEERSHLSRALRVLGLFVAWLVVSLIGPAVHAVGGLDLEVGLGLLAVYSVFTTLTYVVLAVAAFRVVRSRGALRGVLPFVVAAAAATGVILAAVTTEQTLVAIALGVAVTSALLVTVDAMVHAAKLRRLREEKRASVPPPSLHPARTSG